MPIKIQTQKLKPSEHIVSFGLRNSDQQLREFTGHPLEMIVKFADGHIEHAESAAMGLNIVLVCESGIFIIAGKLLNSIKIGESPLVDCVRK